MGVLYALVSFGLGVGVAASGLLPKELPVPYGVAATCTLTGVRSSRSGRLCSWRVWPISLRAHCSSFKCAHWQTAGLDLLHCRFLCEITT